MKLRARLLFVLTLCFIKSINAQLVSLHADEILKEAYREAAKEKKNVFIIFHASWCGWCHKMDTAMNDKSVKKYFDDNYVIRHMVVYESKEKSQLENPGAIELLKKYNGNDEGIPYWLIFDHKGNLLADSKMRSEGSTVGIMEGQNSGCPASKEEVDYFITVLRKTTSLNSEQLAVIEKRFRQNAN